MNIRNVENVFNTGNITLKHISNTYKNIKAHELSPEYESKGN